MWLLDHSRQKDNDRERHSHHHQAVSRSGRPEGEESARQRRERDWEAETPWNSGNHSSYRSSATGSTSRYIETPQHLRLTDTPSSRTHPSTPWERDETEEGRKRFRYEYTPLQTPSFMHNPWMRGTGGGRNRPLDPTPAREGQTPAQTPFVPLDEKEMEAEVERLDRNWYLMDDGYDDGNNPFIGEYT